MASVEPVDLIVVGGGAGGMTAALVAALEGLKVVLCEATEQVGGTTATSAGTLWAPGNRHGAEAGHGDTVADAARYLDALIGPDASEGEGGWRRAFLDSIGPALDDLERRSAVAFASSGRHPDYLPLPGAALSGRAVSPLPFDGRLLGADFLRVRPPLPHFMLLGGMMVGKTDVQSLLGRYRSWSNFSRSVALVLRHARDRLFHPRGTRLVMGNALVARLLYSLRRAGVDIRFGWRMSRLVQEEGRVVGACFEVRGIGERRLDSRAGVVLATGGVGHGEPLRRELAPADFAFESLAADGVRGEGIQAARHAGGHLQGFAESFLWQPVSRVPGVRGAAPSLFPHLYLDRAKPGLIAVNRQGRRFVNEASSYHHFVDGMLRASREGEGAPFWLVCDADFVRRYGLGAIPPGTRNLRRWTQRGYLVTAPTLAILARRLGLEDDALARTVAQHNQFAATGIDAEFGKGDAALDRFNGDPSRAGNPCLGPIGTPPYCALAIWPADAASSAGIRTNRDAQALQAGGAPIPGLYACGNDAASVMRGAYPGPGATLGPAVAAGWRAGRHAAACLATRAPDPIDP
ncbi:FAD-dependent oxidoreductase [Variovorax sp. Root473]|uniref:FAD-dependent oxidoreductase n=1 Tax=Variovorax sp. Root473 TaxID=1736541 RepID=UPI000AE4E824|nr:FAD-dependent oxidoreductase [Variovorax sp. Root473]